MNSDLSQLQNIIEKGVYCDNYKLFNENERLQAIGSIAKEIENTGYAFKTNNKRYPLIRKGNK